MRFRSLECLTNSMDYCGGIPSLPPQNVPCVPLKGDKKTTIRKLFQPKALVPFETSFSPQASTQMKTKRIREKLETAWKGNGKTLFCWRVFISISVINIYPGREQKEGGSKLLCPDLQGTPLSLATLLTCVHWSIPGD